MGYENSTKPVAICDTEPVAIEGMRTLLSQCNDLRLLAAESSLLGGLQMVRQHSPAVLIPDKAFGPHAVMDCLQRLRASSHRVAAVVWGVSLTESEALHMLQMGALGVVRKTATLDSLLQCLRAA